MSSEKEERLTANRCDAPNVLTFFFQWSSEAWALGHRQPRCTCRSEQDHDNLKTLSFREGSGLEAVEHSQDIQLQGLTTQQHGCMHSILT